MRTRNLSRFTMYVLLIVTLLGRIFGPSIPRVKAASLAALPVIDTVPSPNIVGMAANESKWISFNFTETAGGSGWLNSYTYRFYTQYGVPLNAASASVPINLSISLDPNGTSSFSSWFTLPQTVVSAAQNARQYVVILKVTFKGQATTGESISTTGSVLIFLSPVAFNKISPINGVYKQSANPTLSWNSGLGSYSFEYCIDTINDNNCNTGWIGTYENHAQVFNLLPNTTYYWQVRALTYIGSQGPKTYANGGKWFNFKVIIASPAAIAPGSPLPGTAVNINTRRPTFFWTTVAGAVSYTVEVSTSPVFSSKAINTATNSTSYTHRSDLAANTAYYWRVKANSTNGPSAYSEVFAFTTGNPPSVPVLSAPASNALVATLQPKFDWNNSTIPLGTAFDHYQIQVATSNTFASPVIDADTDAGVITNSDYTPALPLTPGTTYYWHVRSWNAAGDYSAWSAVRSVRIKYTAPVLLEPVNSATGVLLKPTFTWEPAPGAASYTLQVSKTAVFSSFVINKTLYTPTYTHTLNLLPNTVYYWRVRVNGPYGPSLWSPVFEFRTQ